MKKVSPIKPRAFEVIEADIKELQSVMKDYLKKEQAELNARNYAEMFEAQGLMQERYRTMISLLGKMVERADEVGRLCNGLKPYDYHSIDVHTMPIPED